MSYAIVENFAGGVDRSRPIYALPPGTLWSGINGHISRGGDFEQRKAFVLQGTVPGTTWGLFQAGGNLYVFGSDAAPSGLLALVTYQRLQHPDGLAMTDLLSVDRYNGKVHAVAQYSDGSVHNFYDGTRVSDWDDGVVRSAMVNNDGIATHLKELIDRSGGPTFTATVAGAVVTVTKTTGNFSSAAAVIGTAINVTGGTDDQTLTVSYSHPAATATFTVGGTFEVGDRFTIEVEGVKFGADAMPTERPAIVRTHKRKVYFACGSILQFTGLDAPTALNTDDDAGAGFIAMNNHEGGSETITALATYQNLLAVFSRRVIQTWSMANDDANNAQVQVINETGTVSPRSVLGFGEIDAFYLSDNGIRSLRARDVTNIAGVNDVGTPIDTLVQDHLEALTDEQVAAAVAAVEPRDGRFWLAVGERIYVFSYFPSKKISAWTWYEPGFEVSDFAVVGKSLYVRDTNGKIYLYGGSDNATYDDDPVTCWIPFMSIKQHGTFKEFGGVDIAADGAWDVELLLDPNDTNQVSYAADGMTGFTFNQEHTPVIGYATHVSVRLTRAVASRGSVSFIGIYYAGADKEM